MVILMKYIDYNTMKDFYTVDEVCRLFEMDMPELQRYSKKYNVLPQEDLYGNWGYRKVLVRKLHNFIYKEQRSKQYDSDNAGYRYNRPHRDPWGAMDEGKRGPWD